MPGASFSSPCFSRHCAGGRTVGCEQKLRVAVALLSKSAGEGSDLLAGCCSLAGEAARVLPSPCWVVVAAWPLVNLSRQWVFRG